MSVDLNDEESFFVTQATINKQLEENRLLLETPSGLKVCIDCGEEIGEKRLELVPSATRCIDCAKFAAGER